MTEHEWLANQQADQMIYCFVNWPSPGAGRHPLATDRKLRLFSCQIFKMITGQNGTQALEQAYRMAEGLEERGVPDYSWVNDPGAISAARWATRVSSQFVSDKNKSNTVRHIFGNIFHHIKYWKLCPDCNGQKGESQDSGGSEPWGAPIDIWVPCQKCNGEGYIRREQKTLSSEAIKLAEAMYEGEECEFALHDELLDCGEEDVAKHFLEKEYLCCCGSQRNNSHDHNSCGPPIEEYIQHPRGCFALDWILGKE